jgi:hypothetical protein
VIKVKYYSLFERSTESRKVKPSNIIQIFNMMASGAYSNRNRSIIQDIS